MSRKIPPNKKGLIIMDNSRAHYNSEIKYILNQLNYDILLLPPNSTSFLQPLDIAFNKYFKINY